MDRQSALPRPPHRPPSPRRLRAALGSLVALAGLVGALAVAGRTTASAAGTECMTSGPSSGAYSVTICIKGATPGATVTGDVPIRATVSTTGGAKVQRVIFFLGGEYVLTDFSADKTTSPPSYGFTLRTTRYGDGSRSLSAEALINDGWDSKKASISLKFANGQSQPPANTRTFQPAAPAAVPGQPLVVAAVGDGAGGEASEEAVVGQIASWNPGLLLYLGDVYMKGSPAEFDNWYGHGNPSYYGRFRSITNPAIGNHEYENNAAPGYFDYWDNVPHYYSFDAGGWHFVSLDSTSQLGEMEPGSGQYEWLARDLASSSAPCTVVYYHHPLFDIGEEGSTARVAPIWRLLAERGVDIVLNGHDHTYQRWVPLDGAGTPDPQGVTEFVVGTGGHSLQAKLVDDPRVAGSSFGKYGALKLELGEAGAAFSFIDENGNVLDSGVTACSGAPAPGSNPPAPPVTPTTPVPPVLPAPPVDPGPAAPALAAPISLTPRAPAIVGGSVGTTPAAPRPPVRAGARGLTARLLARRLAASPWSRLAVRYLVTAPGKATVTVLQGKRRIVAVSGQARRGRNLLTVRAPIAPGRYVVVLAVRGKSGGAVVDRGVLTIRSHIEAGRAGS